MQRSVSWTYVLASFTKARKATEPCEHGREPVVYQLRKTRFATCLVVHDPGGALQRSWSQVCPKSASAYCSSHARQGFCSELEPLGLLDAGEK